VDVVVTGSAGFIGAALVQALRDRWDRVRGLDLRDADIVADVGVPGPWQDRLAGAEVVVHTAAMVGMPSDARRFWVVNTLGTRHVLDAALRAGVRRFVLLSSVTVFGNDFPDQVTEEHPVRPTGVAYPDSKVAAEHAVLDTHVRTGIETVVVRPADVYGPGSRPWTVLPVQMIASRRVAVPTTGIHSPLYVDDVVAGIVAAATAPGASGHIVTLSTGVGVRVGEFFDRYAAMLGRRRVPRLPRPVLLAAAAGQSAVAGRVGRSVELSPAAVRYLADRRGTYCAAKAQRLLGWSARVDLDEGMHRTQAWLRARGMLG
jgi:nucleoside-diphosphate-sugar epimerase